VIEASESRFVWRERTAKITDHYKLTDALAEGASKTARIAIHKLSGIERGVLQKSFKAGSVEREQLRKKVLDHLARFDHPSIVKLIEVFEDDQNVYLVTEALKGDNIIENLWKQGAIHEGMAASVLQQVLAGVRYMHGKNLSHNQLNPTNIHHLNSGPQSTVKIIDSDQIGADLQIKDLEKFLGSSKVDNACYVAPELIRGDWHIKNDIWSAGVLMYTMLTGHPPFWGENQKEVFKLITTYKFDMTHVRW
jgi:calcium-dependent protein kinase